jgi:hypothetical protein
MSTMSTFQDLRRIYNSLSNVSRSYLFKNILVAFITSFFEFTAFISIGLATTLLLNPQATVSTLFQDNQSYQIFAPIIKVFAPSSVHVLYVCLLFVACSFFFRGFYSWFTPKVVSNVSSDLASVLLKQYLSLSYLNFCKIGFTEFNTSLRQDLAGVIDNGLRPSLTITSSLLTSFSAILAAYFSSPRFFLIVVFCILGFYIFFYRIFYRKFSHRSSVLIPILDRDRNSLIEYIYHSFDRILLYQNHESSISSLASVDGRYHSVKGLTNFYSSLPRILLEATAYIGIVLISLFNTTSRASFSSLDFATVPVLLFAFIRLLSSIQIFFDNYGTLKSNQNQFSRVSRLL